MSDTRFAPVDAPERETLREPARAWKNVVWHPEATPYKQGVFGPGDVCSRSEWPTKEVAEAMWLAWASAHTDFVDYYGLEYVGAFPADEAP